MQRQQQQERESIPQPMRLFDAFGFEEEEEKDSLTPVLPDVSSLQVRKDFSFNAGGSYQQSDLMRKFSTQQNHHPMMLSSYQRKDSFGINQSPMLQSQHKKLQFRQQPSNFAQENKPLLLQQQDASPMKEQFFTEGQDLSQMSFEKPKRQHEYKLHQLQQRLDRACNMLITGIPAFQHKSFILQWLYEEHFLPDFACVHTIYYSEKGNWVGLMLEQRVEARVVERLMELDSKYLSKTRDVVVAIQRVNKVDIQFLLESTKAIS